MSEVGKQTWRVEPRPGVVVWLETEMRLPDMADDAFVVRYSVRAIKAEGCSVDEANRTAEAFGRQAKASWSASCDLLTERLASAPRVPDRLPHIRVVSPDVALSSGR